MLKLSRILKGATALSLAMVSVAQAQSDRLMDGFRDPPAEARPQLWWHWMNGNIDSDGAKRDLDWMKRIGIGGVHLFEAGMGTPTIVPERRVYMSEAWRKILRDSVATAASLDLPLGIATSAGWSATGGPWVRPEDAMKKLVWSETLVEGGRALSGRIAPPPSVAGPYQDVALSMVQPGESDGPSFYQDAFVFAMPVHTDTDPVPASIMGSSSAVDDKLLRDNHYGTGLTLSAEDGAAWLRYGFATPQKIRSVKVGLPGPRGFGTAAPPLAFLEASDDGISFRIVAELPPSTSPVRSASFPSVTARWFRLRLAADTKPGFMDRLTFAPGALRPPFPGGPARQYILSEFMLSREARISRAEEKAGFATLPDYDATPTVDAAGISPDTVKNLTGRLRPDGSLDWTPPRGRWRILRMGWSLTGHRNGPAPEEATGLEVDKLSAPRVGAYLDHFLNLYRQTVGTDLIGAKGITSLLSDSIEAGPQNWTEDMPAQFAKRRGYDPTPWLPALTGIIIGDAQRTEAFLWDWRRTIAELYAQAHYGMIARAAHQSGMTYYAEALEDHRPQLGDDMAMRAAADVPMGAMWTLEPGAKPNPTYVADIKGAASVANIYGKAAVGAESLTAFGHPWAYAPADLKSTADLEFALGVNRLLIHTSAHQPFADRAPGLALAPFLGQYFTRNESWAEMADGWTDYLARTSFLLQQGHHVADIAYFYGEESPITALYGDTPVDDAPAGHDYDFVNADALANRLRVVDGGLSTPDGQSYRLLYLGGSSRRLTLSTLRRLERLLQDGATIVGKRPVGSPSLGDDPAQVAALIARLWDGKAAGKGRLFPDGDLQKALEIMSMRPDWAWSGQGALAVLHRTTSQGEIYFLSNRSNAAATGTLELRVTGRTPEIWHADTGRTEPASYDMDDKATRIPLSLGKDDAIFIMLRRPTTIWSTRIAPETPHMVARLDKGWRLAFQPRAGAPIGERSVMLQDWARSADPAVRYFSGVGSYSNRLSLPKDWTPASGRLLLDLGKVADVAEIWINGQRTGVAWKAPYQIDVTRHLKPGRNDVTIRVANLWVNRLIGDAQPGARQQAFTTGPTYAADAPLRPSGLIGPVALIGIKED